MAVSGFGTLGGAGSQAALGILNAGDVGWCVVTALRLSRGAAGGRRRWAGLGRTET